MLQKLLQKHRVAPWAASLAAAFVLIGAMAAPPAANAKDRELPFERTEEREDCRHFDPLKQPFFGTTHLHTGLSFDASIRFVPSTPREAYAFAKKEAALPGVDQWGVLDEEKYTIDRPIDWGLVTDHSEQFGEMGICHPDLLKRDTTTDTESDAEKPAGYYSLDCQLLRGFYWQHGTAGPGSVRDKRLNDATRMPPALKRNQASTAFSLLVMPALAPGSKNARMPMCNSGEANCDASELTVWKEMQAAAEEAYDRSAECKFTSFIAYEAASTPSGVNWHRNVIFRNDKVVHRPITTIHMADVSNPDPNTVPMEWFRAPAVEKLWKGLKDECLDADTGCDVLTIPHNSNLGGGIAAGEGYVVPPLFFDPRGATEEERRKDAADRQAMEPLVEIYQDKGSSECHFDPRFNAGVGTTDELCSFEILDTTTLLGASGVGTGGSSTPVPPTSFDPRAFVRNVLKDGLAFQKEYGVNPFKLGIVAASDSHNGTMGWHPEDSTYQGHEGIEDAIPVQTGGNIQNSSGGHSVVWAEENSRDSVFEALKRRETYGTSGTRPVVRFFGGWGEALTDDLCKGTMRQLAEKGYQQGVPMGGDLESAASFAASGKNPTFVLRALKDDFINTPLQQIQIIKGWLDKDGNTQEKVLTVAGGPNGAWVNRDTCAPEGPGADDLCGVWKDEDFDPEQPAFYYARVLENPVCRYSTHICRDNYGVDPLSSSCSNQLKKLQGSDPIKASQAASCCMNETTNYHVQPVIQERAWTSPIWFTPAS